MTTWEQLRQWDAGPVGVAADGAVAAKNEVVALQGALDAAEADIKDWGGQAGEQARADLAQRRQELQTEAAELGALAEMLEVTEADITALVPMVEETDQLAATHDFRIEDGTVVDAATGDDADSPFRPMVKAMLEVRVRTLLASAEDIDGDLNAVYADIEQGRITDGEADTLAGAAREGQKRIELAEILEDYQTHEEKTVEWGPPGLKQKVTESEAKLLSELNPLELLAMRNIREDSGKVALARYPEFEVEGDDYEVRDRTRANAFKHAYWNAMMTREFGVDWAEKYGTAHERVRNDDPHNEAMDLHNNEVGRRIAEENPDASPEELADLIQEAERNGELVALDENGEIQYTDDL